MSKKYTPKMIAEAIDEAGAVQKLNRVRQNNTQYKQQKALKQPQGKMVSVSPEGIQSLAKNGYQGSVMAVRQAEDGTRWYTVAFNIAEKDLR